jgi:hypothetical protein
MEPLHRDKPNCKPPRTTQSVEISRKKLRPLTASKKTPETLNPLNLIGVLHNIHYQTKYNRDYPLIIHAKTRR